MTDADRNPPEPDLPFSLEPLSEQYVLQLYVTGMTPRSTDAIARVKDICEEYLHGRYALEVVDVYQQPMSAKHDQIIAIPTLVRKLPLPLRRLVGDLSDKQRVLQALGLGNS